MKVVKLSKKDLNGDLSALYIKYNLVQGKTAYPDRMFITEEDMRLIITNYTKLLKKEHPTITAKQLAYSVGVEMLNLSPSLILSKGLKPGYAIIDEL